MVRLIVAGDCANSGLRGFSADDIRDGLRERIRSSDVFIFNLEGPVVPAGHGIKPSARQRVVRLAMRCARRKPQPCVTSDEALLAALKLAPVNVACLANNHILDAGEEGIMNTVASLRCRGFLFLGAGKNSAEAAAPVVVRVSGRTIGLVNFNLVGLRKGRFYVDAFGARRSSAGAARFSLVRANRVLRKLRTATDLTVTVLHMGRILHDGATDWEQDVLRNLESDVTLVSHAHVRQVFSAAKAFSCGDFVFSDPNLREGRTSQVCEIRLGTSEAIVVPIEGSMVAGVFEPRPEQPSQPAVIPLGKGGT